MPIPTFPFTSEIAEGPIVELPVNLGTVLVDPLPVTWAKPATLPAAIAPATRTFRKRIALSPNEPGK
ncbi:hypothetical protein [Terriglobus albidus]|uniref:hypothetical protein n=1 Tax=Terriglobus albidus TaxID=1592106 RepID=UPI0021E003E1|nr:hypothetical protein [Terriglobus albidus]